MCLFCQRATHKIKPLSSVSLSQETVCHIGESSVTDWPLFVLFIEALKSEFTLSGIKWNGRWCSWEGLTYCFSFLYLIGKDLAWDSLSPVETWMGAGFQVCEKLVSPKSLAKRNVCTQAACGCRNCTQLHRVGLSISACSLCTLSSSSSSPLQIVIHNHHDCDSNCDSQSSWLSVDHPLVSVWQNPWIGRFLCVRFAP